MTRAFKKHVAAAHRLSIVIPVHNEAGNIVPLFEKLDEVLSQLPTVKQWEIIFVDDGSTDETHAQLRELLDVSSHVCVVTLRRRFGKSAALTAGFQEASGDIVITMDGDLQDDPQEISKFLEKLHEGYDLVSGWKKERHDPAEKRYASKLFNFIVSKAFGIAIHDFNCGFKAYRSWCLKELQLTGNLYRFIPALVGEMGGKICEIPVRHHERSLGKSKYGAKRYLHGLVDLCTTLFLVRFFQAPLYLFASIAAPVFALGCAVMGYLLVGHVYFLSTGAREYMLVSRPLLQISITLIGIGLQIFLFGVLSEMILRVSKRASFHTREKRRSSARKAA